MDYVLPNHKQVYLGAISTLFLFISIIATAQDKSIDSLQREYQIAASEKLQIDILNKLSFAYTSYSHEKSRELAKQAIEKSQKIGYEKGVADGHN
jgi:hypothetical protein